MIFIAKIISVYIMILNFFLIVNLDNDIKLIKQIKIFQYIIFHIPITILCLIVMLFI